MPDRPDRLVWRSTRTGSLEGLRCEADRVSPPGPDEVTVAVRAIGLNFADVFAVLGLYSATPPGVFIPGLEFAGLVREVGEGVTGFRPGQAVMGLTRFGAYATVVSVDARYVRPLPAGWSFADGAAFPAQALTAWYAIRELGAFPDGGAALVHSAAGGVGLLALTLLGRCDARVVATVGRPEKRDLLVRDHGLRAEQVIVRDARRFRAQLAAALEAIDRPGFDLVLDSVSGPYFTPGYERLNPAGRLVVFGAADLMPRGRRPNWARLAWQYLTRPRVDPLSMISDNRSVMGFNLIWLWDHADRLGPAYRELDRLMGQPPTIGRRFAFAEAPAALRFLQSGASVGKVVLEVPE